MTKGEIAKFDFFARKDTVRILREVRIYPGLRKPARGDVDAFPYRRI